MCVCVCDMLHAATLLTYADQLPGIHEIQAELERLPTRHEDVRLSEKAEHLARHPCEIGVTGGELGRDGDWLALKNKLELLNGNVPWTRAATAASSSSDSESDSDNDGVSETDPEAATAAHEDDDFVQDRLVEAQLCVDCSIYGPWQALKVPASNVSEREMAACYLCLVFNMSCTYVLEKDMQHQRLPFRVPPCTNLEGM